MPPKMNPKATTADGKEPPGKEAPGSAAEGGVEQMEVTPGGSSAVQKVRQVTDKLQAACGQYAEQLAEAVGKRLLDHGVTDVILKDVKSFVSHSKGTSEIGQLVEELRKAIPVELPGPTDADVHPGIKQLSFQDLVANARSDLEDSIDELVEWLGQEMKMTLSVESNFQQR